MIVVSRQSYTPFVEIEYRVILEEEEIADKSVGASSDYFEESGASEDSLFLLLASLKVILLAD